MRLDYLGVGFRAESSSMELQKICDGKDYDMHLIEDALSLASSCREACSLDSVSSLSKRDSVYFNLIYGDVLSDLDVVSVLNSMDVAFCVSRDISRGKIPFLEKVEQGIEFFDMIYEKCLNEARR